MTNEEVVREWKRLCFGCEVLDTFMQINLCAPCKEIKREKFYVFMTKQYEKDVIALCVPFITKEGYEVVL